MSTYDPTLAYKDQPRVPTPEEEPDDTVRWLIAYRIPAERLPERVPTPEEEPDDTVRWRIARRIEEEAAKLPVDDGIIMPWQVGTDSRGMAQTWVQPGPAIATLLGHQVKVEVDIHQHAWKYRRTDDAHYCVRCGCWDDTPGDATTDCPGRPDVALYETLTIRSRRR